MAGEEGKSQQLSQQYDGASDQIRCESVSIRIRKKCMLTLYFYLMLLTAFHFQLVDQFLRVEEIFESKHL